jgi:hypothetical protein
MRDEEGRGILDSVDVDWMPLSYVAGIDCFSGLDGTERAGAGLGSGRSSITANDGRALRLELFAQLGDSSTPIRKENRIFDLRRLGVCSCGGSKDLFRENVENLACI